MTPSSKLSNFKRNKWKRKYKYHPQKNSKYTDKNLWLTMEVNHSILFANMYFEDFDLLSSFILMFLPVVYILLKNISAELSLCSIMLHVPSGNSNLYLWSWT